MIDEDFKTDTKAYLKDSSWNRKTDLHKRDSAQEQESVAFYTTKLSETTNRR